MSRFPLKLLLALSLLSLLSLAHPGEGQSPIPVQAADAVCQWELVDASEHLGSSDPAMTVSRSGGLIETSYTFPGNMGCDEQTYNTYHRWNEPGDTLTPGDTIIFDVQASWELVGTSRCVNMVTGIQTSVTAGSPIVARQKSINVSKEPNGSVANSGDWVVPEGSAEGATMSIIAHADAGGVGGSVYYNYQYVCSSSPAAAGETPTAGAEQACFPQISNLDGLKPGDVLSPAASYVDANGKSVGIIGEAWFINGTQTSSTVWDGKETVLELQYTCLDHSGYTKTIVIPAYGAPQPTPTVQNTAQPAGIPMLPGGLPTALVILAVVVGVGGAGAAGGAVVIKVLRDSQKAPKPPKGGVKGPPKSGKAPQDPKKEKLKRYYLSANTSQITLSGGESQNLLVEAWEAVAGGATLPCAASLQIIAPSQSGLKVSPAAGQGKIACSVSAGRGTRAGSYTLRVQGTTPDGQVLQASIQVLVRANQYELRCNPQEFELRPSEEKEIEVSLWRITPGGGQELDPEIEITLDLFGQDNPLEVEPWDGRGKFTSRVSLPSESQPHTYYLQAQASPPDQEALKTLITVQAIQPPSLVVVFNKPLWEPDFRTDLYTLKDLDPQALDELAMEGGQVLVRAFGEFRSGQETIRCDLPIEDGECRLEREGQAFKGVWEASEYGYRIQVPPLPGNAGGDQAHKAAVAIPVPKAQARLLTRVLEQARRAGNGLGQPLGEQARGYIRNYLEFISKSQAASLTSHKKEILTWLFNTASFSQYSAESIDAFKLALNLHESAYRRFFNAMINAILEVLFWLVEKLASKAWRTFVNSGGEAVQEGVEAQTKEAIGEMLEKETRALADQNQAMEAELKQAAQETAESRLLKQSKEQALIQSQAEIRRIEGEIAEEKARYETRRAGQQAALAEAKAADDVARQQALEREMAVWEKAHQEQLSRLQSQLSQGALSRENVAATLEALETEINRKTLELKKLAGELQGAKTQMDTLEQMGHKVRSSSNMKEVGEALSGAKPGPASLDPQIQRALDGFADGQWKQLDEVLGYLEKNRGRLGEVDDLILRVRAMQANLRKELGAETIKMTYNDFVIKPEFQEWMDKINQANTQTQQSTPGGAYRAVERKNYEEGLFGWIYYGMDKSLEWLYPMHEWARKLIPGIAWSEDLLVMAFEAILERLVKLSNLMIEFSHWLESVRSAIEPSLRSAGTGTAKSLGVGEAFFHFPQGALQSLGQSLQPKRLTKSYTSRAAMQASLKAGAENGYGAERTRQKEEAFLYFENCLVRALIQSFDEPPYDNDLSVSVAMIANLERITQTMGEYVKGFQTAESSGGDALANLDARLWENKEWTAQDLETLVEWIAWGVQAVAVLLGALGLVSGIGAAAGVAMLGTASMVSMIGAALRVGIIALFTLPNIVGFQYDVIAAHALMYEALYEGSSLSPDEVIVDRYYAGPG